MTVGHLLSSARIEGSRLNEALLEPQTIFIHDGKVVLSLMAVK
jgi:hypothetical protein